MIHAFMAPILLLAAAGVDPNSAGSPSLKRILEAEALEEPQVVTETPPLSAAALCARGETSLQDGSRSALLHARSLHRLAVEWYPKDVCGHAGLARSLTAIYLRGIEEDDTLVPQALASAGRAMELDPKSAPAHAALAAAQLADLRTEEARATARSALELDPDCVAAQQIGGQVSAASGRYDMGRKIAARAIALHPDLPMNHQIMGNIQFLSGEYSDAIDSYRVALTLSPDFPPALMQMAAAYEQWGDLRQSGRLFERILRDHPGESSRSHLYMGYSLMQRRSWNAGLGAFEKVSFKTGRGLCDGTVIFLRGICYSRLGRGKEAREAFREVIEKWPDATGGPGLSERLLSQAYEELARLALDAHDTEGAAAILEEGAGHPSAGPDLLLRLARLYLAFNLPDRAFPLLEKAASADLLPGRTEPIFAAYTEWARLAKQRKDDDSLQRLVRSLEARSPSLAEIRDYVLDLEAARAFSIAGHGTGALSCLRRAIEAGYSHLGWIDSDAEMESLRKTPGYSALLSSTARDLPPTN